MSRAVENQIVNSAIHEVPFAVSTLTDFVGYLLCSR
jgi:hypothetical protein